MPRVLAWMTAPIAVALLTSACGGDDGAGSALKVAEFETVAADAMPATVLDLVVGPEDFSATLLASQEAYIDALGVFGMRRDDLLYATVQVSRFDDPDTIADPLFQRSLAGRLGDSGRPSVVRVGQQSVYLMPSGRQTLGVWFVDDEMFVLTVRPEYEQPRRLVRALVEATA